MNNNIIYKNVNLKDYTSCKTGGVAKYFIQIDNVDDLVNNLDSAKKEGINIFVLGGGSNVLINDNGFDGLVVKIQNQKLKVTKTLDDCFEIAVGAGWNLNNLIMELAQQSISCVEDLYGIPGTVGGSIRGNCGVTNFEIKDVVSKVYNLD
ncbi:MAG TPA: FAD-binding protein [Candidatus Paceibacterota bacterium]|nr:FAD-binding protein [Candidatus Paceibacterota bacterium]